MELVIGKGISLVEFGIFEAEAIQKLGKPDKSFTTDAQCKRLQYFDLRLELSFEPENDNRLGWIEVHNPDCQMFGRQLIGVQQGEVLDFVESNCNEEPEVEDYGSMESAFFSNSCLELQFEFSKCSNINFGVLYDKNDEPVW